MTHRANSPMHFRFPIINGEPCLRVAMYSHDTMGLGHMRRNLLIAQALVGSSQPVTVLLIAGAREAAAFAMPAGVDCVTLPSFHKEGHSQYRSGRLNLDRDALIRLRGQTIASCLESFSPHVVIVDKVPRGACFELDPSLKRLRSHHGVRVILGMRDILDDPATVAQEWRRSRTNETLEEYFDQILIYGDRSVFDAAREYQFTPDTAAKVHFTGYLDQSARLNAPKASIECRDRLFEDLQLAGKQLVLCTVGGGQDGVGLASAFCATRLPRDCRGVLLTGPFMPEASRRKLEDRAAGRSDLRVLPFFPEADLLIERANHVIAMGGYNTVCSVLSFEKRALIVPRVHLRLEQWLRAVRLNQLGLLDVLHPDQLTAARLGQWITEGGSAPTHVRTRIDLDGLSRVTAHVHGSSPRNHTCQEITEGTLAHVR